MANPKFADFMRELEAEAEAEGPAATEELELFRSYFQLAREVAEARKAKGLSQQQLAKKCGVHQSEISDIERGSANPTFRTLHSVARHLDLRIGLIPATAARKTTRKKTTRTATQPARRSRRKA